MWVQGRNVNISLLHALNHERPVSGEQLAQDYGCSRAAISKQVEQWRQRGVLISSRQGLGYRFGHAYDWWHEQRLQAALPASVHGMVLAETGSTNDAIQSLPPLAPTQTRLLVTDFQSLGRGRRGRHWQSLPGRQMTWSQRRDADVGMTAWSGLSIAIGAVLADTLRAAGFPVSLKWPNDLLMGEAKLGGILLEMSGQAEGPSTVVVGVGLNEYLLPAERDQFSYAAAALQDAGGYDRHALFAALVTAVHHTLLCFPDQGLAPWQDRWAALHAWSGCEVLIERAGQQVVGVAEGVNAQGALQVRVGQDVMLCHAGDVSLRRST